MKGQFFFTVIPDASEKFMKASAKPEIQIRQTSNMELFAKIVNAF